MVLEKHHFQLSGRVSQDPTVVMNFVCQLGWVIVPRYVVKQLWMFL